MHFPFLLQVIHPLVLASMLIVFLVEECEPPMGTSKSYCNVMMNFHWTEIPRRLL
jgi:hypothetical protein